MIKKIILDLIGGTFFVFIIMYTIYDGVLIPLYYSNSLFTVGIVMFSAGLLTVTNASKIFRGIGFVFKKMFTRKVENLSYYEYLLMKDEEKERSTGYPLFFSGLAFIILAIIIS